MRRGEHALSGARRSIRLGHERERRSAHQEDGDENGSQRRAWDCDPMHVGTLTR
jgi:hypothetical protein